LTGQEALRPSEPCHSLDNATPSYYTKNGSFACGISKMSYVCRLSPIGVFIGPWGSSTDLAEAVTRQVTTGRPSHMAGQPMSLASNDFLHRHSLPLGPNRHKGWPAGHPLSPLVSSLHTLPLHVRYILGVTLILVEFQISL
jgi:hypothetical protein